jgi:hypothetical protein
LSKFNTLKIMDTYYRIEFDGSSYVEKDPEAIVDILIDMDVDDSYRITKIQMTVDEYEELREFDGF